MENTAIRAKNFSGVSRVCAAFLALYLAISAQTYSLNSDTKNAPISKIIPPSAEELEILRRNLRTGDLLFRKGLDADSQAIALMSGSLYSHAGVVAQISPQIFIIHAITGEQNEQNAVVKTSLENFLLNSKYYAVGRLKNLDENAAKIFVARLEKELGKPFILAPKNEANLYCTTLIERSLKGISDLNLTYQNLSLPVFRGEYLFPEAFWQGGNLQTIFESRR